MRRVNIIAKHKILISRFIVRQDCEEDKGIKSICIEIEKSGGDEAEKMMVKMSATVKQEGMKKLPPVWSSLYSEGSDLAACCS